MALGVMLVVLRPAFRKEFPMNNILNPLEKEMLIKLYRRSPGMKMGEFCRANNVSDAAFRSWVKRYDEEGLEGLYRSKKTPELLPEGVDKTAESYKRELIRTRIELERLKKTTA
jgi:transposase-like protein